MKSAPPPPPPPPAGHRQYRYSLTDRTSLLTYFNFTLLDTPYHLMILGMDAAPALAEVTTPTIEDVMANDTGGVVLSFLYAADRATVSAVCRLFAGRTADDARFYELEAARQLGVRPTRASARVPLALDATLSGGLSARFLLRHVPPRWPSSVADNFFDDLKIVALTRELQPMESTADAGTTPPLVVRYCGDKGGDRCVVADAPLPQAYWGRGSARHTLHTLPFVWAPALPRGATGGSTAAAAAPRRPPVIRGLGASMISYFEVTIHATTSDATAAGATMMRRAPSPRRAGGNSDDVDDAEGDSESDGDDFGQGGGPRPNANWLMGGRPPRPACVAVGLASRYFPLSGAMPGWDINSYGWHGDDGCVFHGSGAGDRYGPSFGAGDTVGCGLVYYGAAMYGPRLQQAAPPPEIEVGLQGAAPAAEAGGATSLFPLPPSGPSIETPTNSSAGERDAQRLLPDLTLPAVFFTLNGRLQGVAFHDVDASTAWYPVVGLDCPHPVEFNFGAMPFVYNVRALNAALFSRARLPVVPPPQPATPPPAPPLPLHVEGGGGGCGAVGGAAGPLRSVGTDSMVDTEDYDDDDAAAAAAFGLASPPRARGCSGVTVAPPPPSLLQSPPQPSSLQSSSPCEPPTLPSPPLDATSAPVADAAAATIATPALPTAATSTVDWRPADALSDIVGHALLNAVRDRHRMAALAARESSRQGRWGGDAGEGVATDVHAGVEAATQPGGGGGADAAAASAPVWSLMSVHQQLMTHRRQATLARFALHAAMMNRATLDTSLLRTLQLQQQQQQQQQQRSERIGEGVGVAAAAGAAVLSPADDADHLAASLQAARLTEQQLSLEIAHHVRQVAALEAGRGNDHDHEFSGSGGDDDDASEMDGRGHEEDDEDDGFDDDDDDEDYDDDEEGGGGEGGGLLPREAGMMLRRSNRIASASTSLVAEQHGRRSHLSADSNSGSSGNSMDTDDEEEEEEEGNSGMRRRLQRRRYPLHTVHEGGPPLRPTLQRADSDGDSTSAASSQTDLVLSAPLPAGFEYLGIAGRSGSNSGRSETVGDGFSGRSVAGEFAPPPHSAVHELMSPGSDATTAHSSSSSSGSSITAATGVVGDSGEGLARSTSALPHPAPPHRNTSDGGSSTEGGVGDFGGGGLSSLLLPAGHVRLTGGRVTAGSHTLSGSRGAGGGK